MHLLVMAKEPVAGRVKTRLSPPCSAEQACQLAAASLADTFAAAALCGADRMVLALDGRPGAWIPDDFEVIAQSGATFGERLDHAWGVVGGPGLQVGMDTPQISAELLGDALDRLRSGADCLLGPALDGGWWAIGLQQPPPNLFSPVPMSRSDTGALQRSRCEELGLEVTTLSPLRDVDTIEDAFIVAETAPTSRFAAVLGSLCIDRREAHVA